MAAKGKIITESVMISSDYKGFSCVCWFDCLVGCTIG